MRRLVLAPCLALCLLVMAFADSVGPNSPGTITDDASNGGVSTWSNLSNATTSNDQFAIASCGTFKDGLIWVSELTHYLVATDFSFGVPAGSTINGISAEVERRAGSISPAISDASIRLVVGGSIAGSDLSAGLAWSTTEEVITYGGAAELWGLTPTVADVNSSNFGFAISAVSAISGGHIGQCQVDQMRMTVYYTLPSSGAPLRMIRTGSIVMRRSF